MNANKINVDSENFEQKEKKNEIENNLSESTKNKSLKRNIQGIYPDNKNINNQNTESIKDLNDYYSKLENKSKASNTISINDLVGPDISKEITLDIINKKFNNFFEGKVSTKSYGFIKAYAANTNQGIARDYNEDRVSIVININQPNNYKNEIPWPKASFFSVYDGHGGNKCAEFLRGNLLKLICDNKFFPKDIEKAIKYGFEQADKIFLEKSVKGDKIVDKSGSCALILLIIDNKIYVANVGDSRCLISMKNGLIRKDVTRDHKPNYPYEKKRIFSNGGRVYQTRTLLNENIENVPNLNNDEKKNLENIVLLGPYRVFPGNLSVSRTIGDPAAKLAKFGGNPKVVISDPDIYCFDLEKDDIDFLILGCDGIYDNMASKDVFKCAWMVIESYRNYNLNIEENNSEENLNEKKKNVNITCSKIVDFILKAAMTRQSFDNVSCVIVSFKDLLSTINSNKNDINLSPIKKNKTNEIQEAKNIIPEKKQEKSKKVIDNLCLNLLDSVQCYNLNDENDEENTSKNFKDEIEEKRKIKIIEKEEEKENTKTESILNKKIESYIEQKEKNKDNITSENEEIQQKILKNKFNRLFNEFKSKNLENIKKLSLSTKKSKDNDNIIRRIGNKNDNINSPNNKYNISNYDLLVFSSNRNDSKKRKRIYMPKKLAIINKIKPLIINNENNNKIKNNFIDNIHLKIIKKKNSSNFIRSINEEEEESFTVKRQFKSPNPIKINNIDLKQNNKYKLTLNEVFTNINNAGRKEKNLNKKSNSFFSNHILNNLKIKNDGDLYEKNLNSKILQFDLINFNTINERNLNYDVNKNDNFAKLRINKDKNEIKFVKTINNNLINSNHNFINNNIILKNIGKQFTNKSKEKKIKISLKDDMLYEVNRFRFPTLNIKGKNDKIKK